MINVIGLVSVFNTVTQNLNSGANTPILFDGELIDNINGHDSKNNNSRITITNRNVNVIRFRGKAAIDFALNTNYRILILKNNVALTPTLASSGTSSADGLAPTIINIISYWVPCIFNDFFELNAFQNSVGPLIIQNNAFLEAELGVY